MRRRKASKKDGVAGSMPAHRGTVFADGVTTRIDRSGKITAIATNPPTTSGAPINAEYLVLSNHGTLTQERRFLAGAKLTGTDGGANGDYTLDHDDSAFAGGAHGTPLSFETDDQGHITAAVEDPFTTGEGLVFGRSSQIRTIINLAFCHYAEAIDTFYFVSNATNGVVYLLDPITMEHYTLSTHTSKSFTNAIYSATSGLLYLNYGTNSMSINASSGAAVTSGIVASFQLGAAIRASDGVLYGGNGSSGQIERINTANDTAGVDITLTNPMNAGCRKGVTYCDVNDSIYVLSGVKVTRIACTTNVETAIITPTGLAGGSGGGSVVYAAVAGKIFATNNTIMGLIQIDPGTDAQEASYTFPPGTNGSGCNGATLLGRYLYLGVATSGTPGEVLVFDTVDKEFISCLNSPNNNGMTGNAMDGKAGDSFDDTYLVASTTGSNWFFWGGHR